MKKMFLIFLLCVGLMACVPSINQQVPPGPGLVVLDAADVAFASNNLQQDGVNYTFAADPAHGIVMTVVNQNPGPIVLQWTQSRFISPTLGTTPVYRSVDGHDLDHIPEAQILQAGSSFQMTVAPRNRVQVGEVKSPLQWSQSTVRMLWISPFLSSNESVALNLLWNVEGEEKTHDFHFRITPTANN